MKIVWSPTAIQRLEEIADYIAADKPMAAQRWVEELLRRVDLLADHPLSGRFVPEVDDGELREIFHGPYRIVYRPKEHEVRILTVRHGRRLFDEREVDR